MRRLHRAQNDGLSGFSAPERAAYASARAAYARFVSRNSRFLARGETTEPASQFYRRYSIDWVDAWANLTQLANNDVTVAGSSREVWARPDRIDLEADGAASVDLRRCMDEQADRQTGRQGRSPASVRRASRLPRSGDQAGRRAAVAIGRSESGPDVLSRRALLALIVGLAAAVVTAVPAEAAGGCARGTSPVGTTGGSVCVVVRDPGAPSNGGSKASGTKSPSGSAGCSRTGGAKVPCASHLGTWSKPNQCYAAPYDAPAGSPAWQGHTSGSLSLCSACTMSGRANTCDAQVLWSAPGQVIVPPDPGELAREALGLLQLRTAEVRTAPLAPAHSYVGVENWMWVPSGDAELVNADGLVRQGNRLTVLRNFSKMITNLRLAEDGRQARLPTSSRPRRTGCSPPPRSCGVGSCTSTASSTSRWPLLPTRPSPTRPDETNDPDRPDEPSHPHRSTARTPRGCVRER